MIVLCAGLNGEKVASSISQASILLFARYFSLFSFHAGFQGCSIFDVLCQNGAR